jgi:hypothetical protein
MWEFFHDSAWRHYVVLFPVEESKNGSLLISTSPEDNFTGKSSQIKLS